ncbi:hypothetical protein OG272_16105 [Streptomyces sp. NBC_00104]|uniref:hypothetical protein n=1 Tax=Streptomyces sp. NBC_00104 TaxID=2903621 RepID=UPI00324F121D
MSGPDSLPTFLDDLAALTAKHGLRIDGCGCCGSPFLQRANAAETDWPTRLNFTYSTETQRYTVDPE